MIFVWKICFEIITDSFNLLFFHVHSPFYVNEKISRSEAIGCIAFVMIFNKYMIYVHAPMEQVKLLLLQ
jgi:hypothetical protein